MNIVILKPGDSNVKIAHVIREKVFCDEMGIPLEMEIDGLDSKCHHVLIYMGNHAVGTGRIHLVSEICYLARVAVLSEYRGQGIGSIITRELIRISQEQKAKKIHLNAEIEAAELYRKLGFIENGKVFTEAEFPHVKMVPMELEIKS